MKAEAGQSDVVHRPWWERPRQSVVGLTTRTLIEQLREADPDEAHPVQLVEGLDAYNIEVVGLLENGILYIARCVEGRR